MLQHELESAVAAITGESISTIHSLGFSVADPLEVHIDPERRQPLMLDSDSISPTEWPSV